MSESKIPEDWLKKNGYKLKIVYSYAVVNKLNIKSKEDVLKILQATDPENANEEQAEIYSKMLQLFGSRFRKTIEESLED
ncbi:MAG: hypothetical protein Q7R49_00555 [Candidatus Daviesbacteria bacterium]|nr:hypothetical protein [Candidatus Daviesbacteria bacterium]